MGIFPIRRSCYNGVFAIFIILLSKIYTYEVIHIFCTKLFVIIFGYCQLFSMNSKMFSGRVRCNSATFLLYHQKCIKLCIELNQSFSAYLYVKTETIKAVKTLLTNINNIKLIQRKIVIFHQKDFCNKPDIYILIVEQG